jgi:hypothetical protein
VDLNKLGQILVYVPEKFSEVSRHLKIQVHHRHTDDVLDLLFLATVAGGLAWALDLPHFCYGLVAAGFGAGIADIFGN